MTLRRIAWLDALAGVASLLLLALGHWLGRPANAAPPSRPIRVMPLWRAPLGRKAS
ncbi:hypothetical protein ACIPY6_28450 [Streptomyces sp. NPDC090054]|uniref:hypothetical protein n=1 Tax=Streptomyces sp. NPDC090054 TaxID=3365933 RepID=UPI003806FA49